MAKQPSYVAYILEEALIDVPGLSARPMFGAYGMYKDGIFFAIIEDDELFFKVNDETVHEYIKRNSKQFTYGLKNGEISKMNYWKVPDEILEDREEIVSWIERSVQVARENKLKKK